MKYRIIFTTVIVMALSSQLVFAGEITDPAYTTGDPLTATIMNNIRTAVNDNDATKQDRVAGTCVAGQSIRVINADGTVTCEVDTDTNTTYTAGSGISISDTTISARVGADITDKTNTQISGVNIAQGSIAVVEVVSVTVSAPSSGFVLVTHSGYVVTFNEPNTISVGIGDTNTAIDISVAMGSLDAVSTRRYQIPYSVQTLYPVSAAGTFTYFGLAQKNTTFNAGAINVAAISLSAIFIPNRY